MVLKGVVCGAGGGRWAHAHLPTHPSLTTHRRERRRDLHQRRLRLHSRDFLKTTTYQQKRACLLAWAPRVPVLGCVMEGSGGLSGTVEKWWRRHHHPTLTQPNPFTNQPYQPQATCTRPRRCSCASTGRKGAWPSSSPTRPSPPPSCPPSASVRNYWGGGGAGGLGAWCCWAVEMCRQVCPCIRTWARSIDPIDRCAY